MVSSSATEVINVASVDLSVVYNLVVLGGNIVVNSVVVVVMVLSSVMILVVVSFVFVELTVFSLVDTVVVSPVGRVVFAVVLVKISVAGSPSVVYPVVS